MVVNCLLSISLLFAIIIISSKKHSFSSGTRSVFFPLLFLPCSQFSWGGVAWMLGPNANTTLYSLSHLETLEVSVDKKQ